MSATSGKATIFSSKDKNSYYDNGETSHVFYDEREFIDGSLQKFHQRKILLANKSTVYANSRGEVLLQFEKSNIHFKNVLFITNLG